MKYSCLPGLLLCCFLWAGLPGASAQEMTEGRNLIHIPPNTPVDEIARLAAGVTPSPRQLSWQLMELTTFLHFSMNTFYDQEWGTGKEDPARFNPDSLDAGQWVKVCREAGSGCVILTCKHHDGFCLWPSKFTTHSVAASPWKNGKGDVVKEVSQACREQGVKFGIYLSPWDRHEACYGSEKYNTYFMNQLTELLTQYGDIAEVWFDGACGEGPNGRKQVYDWPAYYSLIRKLQPKAVIAIMGPDVRWVGTESGYGRETEWSVVPLSVSNQDSVAGRSQQVPSEIGFIPAGDMTDQDLGSRDQIKKAQTLIWYPSEVDVSIRPGWFWHEKEDSRVKSPEKLLDIYYSSAGRNSLLLLNIPPNRHGLISEADIRSLKEWRKAIRQTFSRNLAENARVWLNGSEVEAGSVLFDHSISTSLTGKDRKGQVLEFDLGKEQTFDVLRLQEAIESGQRVESFTFEVMQQGKWTKIISGTTVGYKRLLRFPKVTGSRCRLIISESRDVPEIAGFGLFLGPPAVRAIPPSTVFTDHQSVELQSDQEGATIYYTLDGSEPDTASLSYSGRLEISDPCVLRFIATGPGGSVSFTGQETYTKAKRGIRLATPADRQYPGKGPLTLVDGSAGSSDFNDGSWLGWNGTKMEADIDLGKPGDIHTVEASFLVSTKSWIFAPSRVSILVSDDGEHYRLVSDHLNPLPSGDADSLSKVTVPLHERCRFVKVIAEPVWKIPAWHQGNGTAAWIFCDEITVN